MKRMEMKYIAIFAIPHAVIIFFCLIMIFSKMATPYILGFGVDTRGLVYVGENEGISIYQNRTQIGCIEIKSDNYIVDVDESDSLRVVYTSRVDWMDLSGNVVKTMDDPNARTYSQLSSAGKRFVSANGDIYKKTGQYGWTRIIKNNSEIVYCQSILSFAVKMLLQVCGVSMFIGGIWVIYRVQKMKAS